MDRNLKDILETVNFIKDYMVANMLTKEDGVSKGELGEALKPIEDRLTAIENKVAGTNRRLPLSADRRAAAPTHRGPRSRGASRR